MSSPKSTYLMVVPWSIAHPGGVNQVIVNLARELLAAPGPKPLIWVTDWAAQTPVYEKVLGLDVVRWRLRELTAERSTLDALKYTLWERRFLPRFAAFCREHGVMALNFHFPGPAAFTLERLLAKLPGPKPIPLLLSFHGSDVNGLDAASPSQQNAWRGLLARVQATVTCSHALGVRIQARLGPEVPIQVVHNGLDAAAFQAMADAAPAPSQPFRTSAPSLLNVGRFEPKKGQDVLIAAFARLAPIWPDLRLTLVGGCDDFLPVLQQIAADAGLSARIDFHVDVPHAQIAVFFRDATVFVMPSRIEPFGIAILEAGALALPVVATEVGGIPEVLSIDTGHLVPADDSAALADALHAVLSAPDAARAMGLRLQQRVRQHFSWKRALQQYLSLARDTKHP